MPKESIYQERVVTRSDRTIVLRSPRFRHTMKMMEYYKPSKGKHVIARWAMALGYWALRRWGEPYQATIETKEYLPIKAGEPISDIIHRQINDLINFKGVMPEDMTILAGAEQWEDLLHYMSLNMDQFNYNFQGGQGIIRREFRNIRVIIIPEMLGVLVVPKRLIITGIEG